MTTKQHQSDRIAERVRKAHSPDADYRHMLETIADDIEAKFNQTDEPWRVALVASIARQVRTWTP